MNLYLSGHSYHYAVEQMLVTLFPDERPEYPTEPQTDGAEGLAVTLMQSDSGAEARATLTRDGETHSGSSHCGAEELVGKLSADRALQKAIKLAIYQAGVDALGYAPPWGAITGVRPVKIPTRAMERGDSAAQAEAILRDTYQVSPDRRRLAMDCAHYSLAAKGVLSPREVSLYIGIPFCPTRCAYCSFVSADAGRTLHLIEPFLDGLEREIAATGEMLRESGLRVRTVYMGGGTPTTLSAGQLDRLMGVLAEKIDLSACTEYTVEAGRPDTITLEKLHVIRKNGGGRVSVNPQSMDDGVLRAMGRAHRAEDILSAYQLVRQSGIPSVNMDLIAGLPTDNQEGFRRSLDTVLALAPENVTVHTLALKKGSRLLEKRRGEDMPPPLPAGAAVAAMLDYAWATLRGAGQQPYYLYRQKYMSGSFENVGWCAHHEESLYNICMMEELHTIVSLGGGGVTKLVNPETGYIKRMANPKYPHEYIRGIEKTLIEKTRVADFHAAMERER